MVYLLTSANLLRLVSLQRLGPYRHPHRSASQGENLLPRDEAPSGLDEVRRNIVCVMCCHKCLIHRNCSLWESVVSRDVVDAIDKQWPCSWGLELREESFMASKSKMTGLLVSKGTSAVV